MTDNRKLLESAAKAMGNGAQWDCPERGMMVLSSNGCDTDSWNPLTYSDDCAAMCAKLKIDTIWFPEGVTCGAFTNYGKAEHYADHNNDREAAWRYAATQVAAAIGNSK